jgi:acetyl esterase/lipase
MMKRRSLLLNLVWIQLAAWPLSFAQTSDRLAATRGNHPEPAATLNRLVEYYSPLQERGTDNEISITRDVSYGPSDRNLADVFKPATPPSAPQPVLLFVHGGGFTGGDRRFPNGAPFYDNIGVWAVRHGFIGVNMTYRLAPQSRWPGGAVDVALAVRYLIANIRSEGGDPNAIFLMGHSAGAVHVATFLSRPELTTALGVRLAGAILVSGAFDIATLPFGDREKAYFGEDATKYSDQSSLQGLLAGTIPLLIVNAEHDPPFFLQQTAELRLASQHRNDRSAMFLILAGHSHMSTVMSINSNDTALSDAIETFVAETLKSRQ